MPYRDELKCEKVINVEGKKCGESPARVVPILNVNLCAVHQKELSDFINHELGEDDYDGSE